MKKILSFLVCLSIILSSMILGLGSAVAYAAKYETSPETDFIAFDGVIEEYVGPGGLVVIPSEIDGEAIHEIAARAFFKNLDISGVIIPEGIEKIGNNAFEGCANLVELELPYSLYYLGATVFGSCIGIEKVVIPSGVTVVPYGTFTGCNALKDIKFSNGVEEIHQFAFCQTSPERIIFPESVSFICGASFNYVNTKSSIEIIICNPNLDLGKNPKPGSGFQDQLNGAFLDDIFRPWNSSITPNMVFKISVPEGSDIAAFVKDWKNNGLLRVGQEEGACNNSYRVTEQDEAYYAKIEEEIAGYSIEKARADLTFEGGQSVGGEESEDSGDSTDSEDGNNTDGANKGNSTNKGNSGGTQTVVEESDNSNLYIILGAVGGLFVLVIAGVAVFAILALKKKPAKKDELTLEELQEQMNRLMKQQAAEEAIEEIEE